jgi:acyl-CoA thioester hydrolase
MTNPARPPELADHAFALPWPVQWGDQDAFGHVNNVVYFRWMESARIEYYRQAGVGNAAAQQGIGPILAAINCNFRRQLMYPDTLLISASITSIGRSSMKMAHRIYSTAQQAIAAEGDSTLVLFDYDAQRPIAVSDEIRLRLEAVEGRKLGPQAG